MFADIKERVTFDPTNKNKKKMTQNKFNVMAGDVFKFENKFAHQFSRIINRIEEKSVYFQNHKDGSIFRESWKTFNYLMEEKNKIKRIY